MDLTPNTPFNDKSRMNTKPWRTENDKEEIHTKYKTNILIGYVL